MTDAHARGQFLRYVIVGSASNGLLYLGYLSLTAFGVGPKISMTLLYAVGVAQTFLFNCKWSFRYEGRPNWALVRYVSAYALGYLLNLVVLWWAVDQLGLPHQIIQGVMILTLAVLLFILQKFWVFPVSASDAMVATRL